MCSVRMNIIVLNRIQIMIYYLGMIQKIVIILLDNSLTSSSHLMVNYFIEHQSQVCLFCPPTFTNIICIYHSLLKLFVDADTNKDGLVSRASFSKLIDAAAVARTK